MASKKKNDSSDTDSDHQTVELDEETNKRAPIPSSANPQTETGSMSHGKNGFEEPDSELSIEFGMGLKSLNQKKVEPVLDILKKCFAEFVGTAMLVSFGCGSVLANKSTEPLMTIAMTFGLTLMVIISTLGPVSGSHVNPVVTLALMLSGRITVVNSIWYVISQIFGGITGSLLLLLIWKDRSIVAHCATVPGSGINPGVAFLVEIVLTFMLIFPILNFTSPKRDASGKVLAPLIIGFALAVAIMFGGNLTGGSLNPARSFGPALVSGVWSHHWVYWLGPVIGSLLASMVFKLLDQEFQGALYTLSALSTFRYHPELNPVKEVQFM